MPPLKPGTIFPTDEEDAVISVGIAADPDSFELQDADITRLRPVRRGRPRQERRKVATTTMWRPQLTDPDDEMVLEAAANGQADRLVTFNRKHFTAVGNRFGIVVSGPGDIVAALEDRK